MYLQILILQVLFSAVLSTNYTNNIQATRQAILKQILKNYDRRMRPGENETPTIVKVHLNVRYISNVDEKSKTFETQLLLRLKWNDERLKYNNSNLKFNSISVTETDEFWIPDLFFMNLNVARSFNILKPNVFLRIYPTGQVVYSQRIFLNLMCQMNLKYYPFDAQSCFIGMASYGYTTDNLKIEWEYNDPVEWRMNLKNMYILHYRTDYRNSETDTGEYSCVYLHFTFQRNLFYHIKEKCMPLILSVLISWTVFWLHEKEIFARVMLGMSALFLAIYKISDHNNALRNTDNIPLHYWNGFCLTFIFASLFESVTANYLFTQDESKIAVNNHSMLIDMDDDMSPYAELTSKQSKWKLNLLTKTFFKLSRPQRLDVISRIVFPLCFVVFNICYWATYLTIYIDATV